MDRADKRQVEVWQKNKIQKKNLEKSVKTLLRVLLSMCTLEDGGALAVAARHAV